METQIRDERKTRTEMTIYAAVICVVSALVFMLGTKAIALSLPAQMAESFSWYGVPMLLLAAGLLLARSTGVWRDIQLLGAGFTLRNAILFGALVIAVPFAWELLLWIGFRVFAPQILSQITQSAPNTGHIIRSIIGSPIGEEVLMRGWLLSWLAVRVKTTHQVFGCTITTANLMSSLTFAGMHLVNGTNPLTPLNLLGIFWVALIMGRAKERTGGLLLPMICHAIINTMSHL